MTDSPAPAVAQKNGIARLAGVLFAPAETFEDIARKPDFLAPILAIILIGILTSIAVVPKLDFETLMREQMAQSNPQMSPEDTDNAVRLMAASGKVLAYAGSLLSIIILLVVAGVLLMAFRLMGGEGTFKQAFSASLYAWMPLVVYSIIAAIIIMSRESVTPDLLPVIVRSNPGFLADPQSQKVLFALLTALDVFTIWTLVLFSIGFSYVARVSKTKAAAIVVSLWIVMLVFKLGFAALGAATAKTA
jgi:hypothetical protein